MKNFAHHLKVFKTFLVSKLMLDCLVKVEGKAYWKLHGEPQGGEKGESKEEAKGGGGISSFALFQTRKVFLS